ncbi:MAG: hypothetical protein JSS72_03945 [Armatimonadetes bacterium]|nr:hypothetical protein [Armatimonadota bacterium]
MEDRGAPMFKLLTELFRESYQGVKPGADGTWYVQGKEAIFPTLREVTGEEASRPIKGSRATLADHAWHTCYYLTLLNQNIRGEHPRPDWEGSWQHGPFSNEEWQVFLSQFEEEFETCYAWYQRGELPDEDDALMFSMANVAHAAFHLGAMRVLLGLIRVG